ncbi:MAG: CGNR zinc finger domain-containing protein [Blastocatellia bacterium]|nr:CGNR zinc finger domain-containing protein [Blastocatellia bacterium]
MDLSERPAARMKLVGERLCLDFVNTVGGWNPDPARAKRDPYAAVARADKLNDYFDLLAWSLHAKLFNENEARALAREAGRREKEAAVTLKRAVALRGAIYRICAAIIHEARPRSSDLELLNQELNISHGRVRLGAGEGNLVWEWEGAKNALDRMLWRVADSAAEMFTTDDLARLRGCRGEDCGWMFLDVSKNSRRQWCDMQTCGNLAKVRRFRQRRSS